MTTTAAHVFMFLLLDVGMSQHLSVIDLEGVRKFGLRLYLGLGTFCLSAAFIKLSILCQYLRIFEKGRVRMLCLVMLIITGVWSFVFLFISWFPCFPVHKAWKADVKGKCYGFRSRNALEFKLALESHASSNMLLDVIILIIPMVLFRKPGLKRRQIWGMLGIFTLGAISCSIASARVYVLAKKPDKMAGYDISWNAPLSILLAALEISVALISASIPVFWPVLVALRVGEILLVREVKVTAETRHRDAELDDLTVLSRTSSCGDSEQSLQCDRSERDKIDRAYVRHSSSKTPLTTEEAYYSDQYVATQVTPLGKKDSYHVLAERSKYLEQMKILPRA
jgi:hypothetical protein